MKESPKMAKEILIADSDKLVREEFQRIFQTTPYHPMFVDNDEEALLRGRLFKPDLIIGGKALCQAVRADEELKEIPFILLLDLFDQATEQERKILRADGMISRPINGNEILEMLEEIGEEGKKGRKSHDGEAPSTSFSHTWQPDAEKKDELFLEDLGEAEEEIIELVDVVEEPETRMSISDFDFQQKGELLGEIAPIESWEKPEGEEEGLEKGMDLSTEEGEGVLAEPPPEREKRVEGRAPQEEDLFEKIELEEIIRKMERLQPSIEREWPAEQHETLPEIAQEISPPPRAEDQPSGLEAFEAALKGEVKTETMEVELQPIPIIEELRPKPQDVKIPEDLALESQLQELTEEEFPEIFLEELTGELDRLKEEEILSEEEAEPLEPEMIDESEISKLFEEASPIPEPIVEEAVRLEEEGPVEKIPSAEELVPIEKEVLEAPPEQAEMPVLAPSLSTEPLGEIPPPLVRLDRKIEETLTKEVQAMVQDFATRIIPEMTKHMITLTMERIEAMVKGIVPDLAEKAIREEIERLQKGEEKD